MGPARGARRVVSRFRGHTDSGHLNGDETVVVVIVRGKSLWDSDHF